MNLEHALSPDRDRRAAGARATSRGLRSTVLVSREDIEALASRWQGLEIHGGGAHLFQSLAWARAVYDFESARGNAQFDPVIATLEDGQRLVGVLPLERVRTGVRTQLMPLGHAFSQCSDVLLAAHTDPKPAVAALLRTALAAAPADGVSLLKVREGSALALGMPRTRILTGQEQGAPLVALDGFDDFESYFRSLRAKTRKNMRNARNRLERSGVLAHEVIADAATQLPLIARTLEGRADRLKTQGLTSRAFRDGDFTAFCKSLVGRPDLSLLAFSLTHDGHPLAEQWGFVQAGRYYAYVASRDFSQSDESPGKLHLTEVLRACAERGVGSCDLGVPVMPYKLTYATDTVSVRDYALPASPRGWAMIQLWDVRLRPSLKRLVLAMPASLRARLMRLAGQGQDSDRS